MKCPHCFTGIPEQVDACPQCGFSAEAVRTYLGRDWVRLERLTDHASQLSLKDRRFLETVLDDFERRFPQCFLAVYIGALPAELTVGGFGFWLLNQGAFITTHLIVKQNDFGVVLVIDPVSHNVGITVGYALESILNEGSLTKIVTKMRPFCRKRDFARSIQLCVRGLARLLKRAAQPESAELHQSPVPSVSDASDLGLQPLRQARKSALNRFKDLFVFGAMVLSSSLASVGETKAAEHSLVLPTWNSSASEPYPENNILLPPPTEVLTLESTSGATDEFGLGFDSHLDDGMKELRLFLHDGVLNQINQVSTGSSLAPTIPIVDLSEDWVEVVNVSSGNQYLLDPQEIVIGEDSVKPVVRLLEYHAANARVPFYLLLLGQNQRWPDDASLDRVAQGALTIREACLVIYPIGEPWRARFVVSQPIYKAVSNKDLQEMVTDCIRDAQRVAEPMEQLHRLSVRLSTRLFWLERKLPVPAKGMASMEPQSVQEVPYNGAVAAAPAAREGVVLTAVSVSLGAVLLLLSLLASSIYFLRAYRRKRELLTVWVLPEPEVAVPARLGGAFSGGSGAAVHYGG